MFVLEDTHISLNSIDFSPDGASLAAGGYWGVVQFWDLASRTMTNKVVRGTVNNGSVAFSEDGTLLVANRGSLLRVDPHRGTSALANSRLAWSLTASPDRKRLCVAYGRENTALAEHSLPDLAVRWEKKTGVATTVALAYSADGRYVAAGNGIGEVQVRDSATGELRDKILSGGPAIKSIALSPDGGLVAFCAASHVYLWRLDPLEQIVHHKFGRTHFLGVAWHPTGGFFATCNGDGKVDYWDAQTGERRESFDWSAGKLNDLVFDATGDRAACSSADGKIVVWDVDR